MGLQLVSRVGLPDNGMECIDERRQSLSFDYLHGLADHHNGVGFCLSSPPWLVVAGIRSYYPIGCVSFYNLRPQLPFRVFRFSRVGLCISHAFEGATATPKNPVPHQRQSVVSLFDLPMLHDSHKICKLSMSNSLSGYFDLGRM